MLETQASFILGNYISLIQAFTYCIIFNIYKMVRFSVIGFAQSVHSLERLNAFVNWLVSLKGTLDGQKLQGCANDEAGNSSATQTFPLQ